MPAAMCINPRRWRVGRGHGFRPCGRSYITRSLIERGVLQGDIFSTVCFIAGLDKIFRLHDVASSVMVVGEAESAFLVSKIEYADDAALVDENDARVTALVTGSMMDAAMLISIKKSKAMHVHKPARVDATTEADVATLGLSHKCDSCGREFTKQRGLIVHMARWCDGGRTQRSRLGTLTDKALAVKTAKRRVAEAALDKVYVGNEALDNVLHFEYLGSQLHSHCPAAMLHRHNQALLLSSCPTGVVSC